MVSHHHALKSIREPHSLPAVLAGLILSFLLVLPLAAIADPTGVTDSRELFIELSASEDRVYIQQELILTVRLFFSSNLIRGELSAPEHPDAVIEQLGRQREFSQDRDGQPYRVVERRYSVFPQTAGALTLPAISFEGLARHPRGHAYRLRTSATLFDVEVRDIPATFRGRTWLPARSLSISERGLPESLPENGPLTTGQSLNRVIEINAAGLQGPVLPPIPGEYPDSLRSYPEPAVRNSAIGPDGISGSLEQSIALVPVAAGDITLPEIRIHWWDVTTDEPRVAVLPGRRYQVLPSSAAGDQTKAAPVQPTTDPAQTAGGQGGPGFWPWLTLAFALGWAGTGWIWWQQRSRPAQETSARETPHSDAASAAFRDMTDLLGSHHPDWVRYFIGWTQTVTERPVHTLDQALAQWQDPPLADLVSQWQTRAWGNPSGTTNAELSGVTTALLTQLKLCRKRGPATGSAQTSTTLPDFYPDKLSPTSSR